MGVPYIFSNNPGPIPLNELDANFAAIPLYANTAGFVTQSAQANITSLGILTALTVSGNIAGNYLNSTGISVTSAAITGNAVVGSISTDVISATAVAAGSVSTTALNSANIIATGNTTVTGNITGGNLTTGGQVTATGNITGSNLITSGQITANGNITGNNLTITNNALISGNITITGNATVNGTTTTVNTQTLNISDKDIVVANNVSTSALINGAGIIAGNPAVSSLIYSHANLGWGTANNFNVGGNVTVAGTGSVTGVLTAPTAANGTNNTQVATTAFVNSAVTAATGSLGTMSTQNANNVSITGGNIDASMTAPTAANGTNNTQVATTAFVNTAISNYAPAKDGTGATSIAGPWNINILGTALSFRSTNGNSQFNSVGVGTAASTTAGEIRATNNITAYYSDDRLKTKLGKIENALDKICALEGFYYEANETAQALGYEVKREVGLSAQSTQVGMPEIVAPAPIDEKYLTIRYEKYAPYFVEAIKELKEQIEEIKRKL